MSEHKIKRTRNRKVASCEPCRARKLRCDRRIPCGACTAKGADDSCVWDPDSLPPLVSLRDQNETVSLRHEVDRLRAIIDNFKPFQASGSVASHGGDVFSFHSGSQASSPFSSSAAEPLLQYGVAGESVREPEEDIAAQDLGHKLGQLAITQFIRGDLKADEGAPDTLARKALDEGNGATPAASPVSVFPFSCIYGSLKDLLQKELPPRAVSDMVAAAFFRNLGWFMHCIPRPLFEKHTETVYHTLETNNFDAVDPFAVATLFAIWGIGLSSGMSHSRAIKCGIQDKDGLAKAWLELSTSALVIGRFLEVPTIEAIRPLAALSGHYLAASSGDDGGAGVALLILCVQTCLQLRLNRDPDKTPGRYSSAVAEDRRRLFWLTFVLDQCSSTTTGNRHSVLHLRDIDTKLPQDVPDELMGQFVPREERRWQETDMTYGLVRIRLAQLAERISDEAFGLQAVAYSQILDMDRRMQELEESIAEIFPSTPIDFKTTDNPQRKMKIYTIHLEFLGEKLRLHRPYLARSFSNATFLYSRKICLEASHRILVIQAAPLCKGSLWACLNYKSVCAAITLAIELLQNPGEGSDVHRAVVQAALERIEAMAPRSTLCRRGSKLVRFLLDKGMEIEARTRLKKRRPTGFDTQLEPDKEDAFPTSSPASVSSSNSAPTPFDPVDMLYTPHPGASPVDFGDLDYSTLLGFDASQPAPIAYSPTSGTVPQYYEPRPDYADSFTFPSSTSAYQSPDSFSPAPLAQSTTPSSSPTTPALTSASSAFPSPSHMYPSFVSTPASYTSSTKPDNGSFGHGHAYLADYQPVVHGARPGPGMF